MYLFNVVSGLRDKSAKGYPIKKVRKTKTFRYSLLTSFLSFSFFSGRLFYPVLVVLKITLASKLWPGNLLGCLQGLINVCYALHRLFWLLTQSSATTTIKSSPLDIEAFRQETYVKYPTFVPPQPPPAAFETPILKQIRGQVASKLAQAYSPIPVRHHYHTEDDSYSNLPHHNPSFQNPSAPFRPNSQPATPAPSPPPGPKPKKQQYQTDQTRPFLFPFSKTQGRAARLVPFAIDEADNLYNRHMYISLELMQMWRTREDCMTHESGLEHLPGSEGEFASSTFTNPSAQYDSVKEDPEAAELLPDLALLDVKIAEATAALENAGTASEKRKAKERREDLMRLKRVEQIYVSFVE